MTFYYHLLAQLLLAAYQQCGKDVPGSHDGQIRVGAQTSPLDSPMRCRVGLRRRFRSPVIFAGRVLRVSAVARRAAAAYGDANML